MSSQQEKFYDFAIIGAGPAGLLSAYYLKKQGHKVIIIEAKKEINRKSCGEYLCPAGVELLKKLELDELLENFLPLKGMKIVSPDGQILETSFPHSSQGVSLDRKIFETRLWHKVVASGVDICWNYPLTKIERDTRGFCLSSSQALAQEKYYSRYLIGADGRHSIVARSFNLSKKVKKIKRVALHTLIPMEQELERWGEMHLFEDGSYIGLNPTGSHEMNLTLVLDAVKIKECRDFPELIKSYLQKSAKLSFLIPFLTADLSVQIVYPLTHQVKSIAGKDYALVGDAAGFVDPLTGEGIYNALLSASILSTSLEKTVEAFAFNKEQSFKNYRKEQNKKLRAKRRLNLFFGWLLKKPKAMNLIAYFLNKKQSKKDLFVRVIGNIESPVMGLVKLFLI
ncbi:MAG: NAD(P)/FAD-dependent oxidoreductase [Bacteriovoracaceae bacterium]|nr:NAD(P)/FAD-dependent oxidoreductase [Bacteriovoracaceae bacterium]